MSNEPNFKTHADRPMVYQIRIKGHLDAQWTDWFDGLANPREAKGATLPTGPVARTVTTPSAAPPVRTARRKRSSVGCRSTGSASRTSGGGGTGSVLPESRRMAGRTKRVKVTIAETGLPGRAIQSRPSGSRAAVVGPPGRRRIRRKSRWPPSMAIR